MVKVSGKTGPGRAGNEAGTRRKGDQRAGLKPTGPQGADGEEATLSGRRTGDARGPRGARRPAGSIKGEDWNGEENVRSDRNTPEGKIPRCTRVNPPR
jgi:hypothetical protein